jgi:ABC-2 type transport system ATP-binding protein
LLPDRGEISVFGYDVFNNPLKAKQLIGYLPEDNPLYGNMYVKEYLEFVASLYSVKNKKEAINNLIEKVGLTSEYKKQINTLSKGNKQRVGLAQALIHDPSFLILDEPTSGLDPNQQIEIRELLLEISKSAIIFFSSHILQEVTSICSRYMIINNGSIVYDEPSGKAPIEKVFYDLTQNKDENSSR